MPAGLITDLSKSKKASASKVILSDDGLRAAAIKAGAGVTGAEAGVFAAGANGAEAEAEAEAFAAGSGVVSTYGAGVGAGVTKGIAAFLSMPSQPSTASAGVQKPVCQQRPKLLLTMLFSESVKYLFFGTLSVAKTSALIEKSVRRMAKLRKLRFIVISF